MTALHPAVFVAIGAGVGSALRYVITLAFARQSEAMIPVATMTVNVIGSLVLGLVTGVTSDEWFLLLGVGLCGGLTTFSAFAAENVGYLNRGRAGMAFVNATLSVVLCIGAAALGLGISANVQP